MNSAVVLFINGSLYTVSLAYFIKKYKLSIGVIIWILYTVSAWFSFLFIQQPEYYQSIHYGEQTLFPCIYLWIIFFITVLPLMKLEKIEIADIEGRKLLDVIMIVCSLVHTIFVLLDLSNMLGILTSGSGMLSQLRSLVYDENGITQVTRHTWSNRLHLIFTGMRLICTGLSVVVLLSSKKKGLPLIFFVSTLLNNIRIVIVNVGRGEIVFLGLLYGVMFYLMRDSITIKGKRRIAFFSIPLVVVGVLFLWEISVSRFTNATYSFNYYLFKYLGEPMNNFNGLLFYKIQNTTNGRAYFSLFYTLFFGEKTYYSTLEKWSAINSITNIRGDIFYTWVGGLIIEFGKVVPVIVAIILNRITQKIVNLKRYYAGDIIIIVFFLNFYIRGIFLFPTQNVPGMEMILYSAVLFCLFRIQRTKEGKLVYKLIKPRKKV